MEESREVDEVSDKIEEFWRDATADDVAMIMRTGKPIKARFRDESKDEWISGLNSFLGGGVVSHREVITWISKTTIRWSYCQVYDPPEWYINKPDPGEGWRLLEKFPNEDLWSSDEAWNDIAKEWEQTTRLTQCESLWYRRRIANSPTSSDSSRSRDNIPSGWRLLGKDEERLASDAYWSQGCDEWLLIGDDRVKYANELDKWHAIRQVVYYDHRELRVNGVYTLPNGQTIRVTAKGFEVV
jgi:hypothetical protein